MGASASTYIQPWEGVIVRCQRLLKGWVWSIMLTHCAVLRFISSEPHSHCSILIGAGIVWLGRLKGAPVVIDQLILAQLRPGTGCGYDPVGMHNLIRFAGPGVNLQLVRSGSFYVGIGSKPTEFVNIPRHHPDVARLWRGPRRNAPGCLRGCKVTSKPVVSDWHGKIGQCFLTLICQLGSGLRVDASVGHTNGISKTVVGIVIWLSRAPVPASCGLVGILCSSEACRHICVEVCHFSCMDKCKDVKW